MSGSSFPVKAPLGCEFAPLFIHGTAREWLRYYEELWLLTVRLARSLCSPRNTMSCPSFVRVSLWSDGRGHGPGASGAVPPYSTAFSHGHGRSLLFPGNPDRGWPGSPPPSRAPCQAIRHAHHGPRNS